MSCHFLPLAMGHTAMVAKAPIPDLHRGDLAACLEEVRNAVLVLILLATERVLK